MSEISSSVRGYLLSVMYLHNWLIHVHASCSHVELSNTYTCIRWMTSQIGYLKLLITRSILSGPLDFEIKRVACIMTDFSFYLNLKRKYEPAHEIWYLSHRRPVESQASLRIRPVLPEPSLFASRWRVQPKIRYVAPLDGCTCTFEEWVYGGRKVP